MPASRSPDATLVSRLRTSAWLVSTAGDATPALASASRPKSPQGTPSAHSPTRRSSSPKSDRPLTPAGLPVGTTISSRLRANVAGSASGGSASTTWVMLATLAEANTSAGAPARICSRSDDEPAKLSSTLTPGYSSSSRSASSPKASVSDAAANTVIDPSGSAAPPAPVSSAVTPPAPSPQAAATNARPAPSADRPAGQRGGGGG